MKLNFDLLWKHERWKRQRKILRVRLFVGTAENDPSMLLGEGKARLFREKKAERSERKLLAHVKFNFSLITAMLHSRFRQQARFSENYIQTFTATRRWNFDVFKDVCWGVGGGAAERTLNWISHHETLYLARNLHVALSPSRLLHVHATLEIYELLHQEERKKKKQQKL